MRTSFDHRRKMVRKSLTGIVTSEQFDAAEVEPTARPEALGVDAWVRLTNTLAGR